MKRCANLSKFTFTPLPSPSFLDLQVSLFSTILLKTAPM
uniref:Uncharacterized protein n=1 Tax=Rhizophora mucronata TaxID=61149 RepID=A0A2P2IVF4_RHIMU